ncbi:Actin/actin-like protein [Haematococcus lacustris]
MGAGSRGPSAIIVIDNGAGNCKIGIGGEAAPRKVFPNCTAKPKGEKQMYVGDMLLDPKSEISQLTLRRPFDRGYLVGWDLEREIWAHAFKAVLGLGRQPGHLNTRDCGLLMSEPVLNFPAIQNTTQQVVFEEFGFQSFHAAPAPSFSLQRMAAINPQLPAAQAGAGVVLDAGFSFTHVIPYFDNQPLLQGVKRINLGGKALSNYLKELVSYRSLNMMDEPYLMEVVKEAVCFVSKDVRNDLKLASLRSSPFKREFVLPDGVSNFRGYLKEPPSGAPGEATGGPGASKAAGPGSGHAPSAADQVLLLNNERFMVPEVLFHPSDVGLKQAGVAEAVVQAVSAVHPSLAPLLYNNVCLTGGGVACPGFTARFVSELRPLVPDDYALGVFTPPDPALCAWEGMSNFVTTGQYQGVAMTKAQYEETGGNVGRSSQRW